MSHRYQIGGLSIAAPLYDFVIEEALPGTGIEAADFWASFEGIVDELGPKLRAALDERGELQKRVDTWFHEHGKAPIDIDKQKQFLTDIGYLVPEGDAFQISPTNVDPEIAKIAGPQLVVPVDNARFALNAANARWGSLYDALYGTDAIDETDGCERTATYNVKRGAAVVRRACEFLDEAVPLETGNHIDVAEYWLNDQEQRITLAATLNDGSQTALADPMQFAGYRVESSLASILLVNHGLHIEIQIDRDHPVGGTSPSGVKDLVLESAVTTIMDCEDSVAAVDAEDKVRVYRNWLQLQTGTLEATFEKSGRQMTRRLNPDREYVGPNGESMMLPGRSLMLVRNVGHLMTTYAVLDKYGLEVSEGILDAMITSLCAKHDLSGCGELRNSRAGSLYIVKPKQHGPHEVALTNTLFERVEDALGLARDTIKVGVMDEERRTTANLKECIRQVRTRLAFINTGFLDRTGDEIHTVMEAGPVLPKEAIKGEPWIAAYEDWNVDIGLECGLAGKAQIGKGMWPKPDEMREMLATKGAHPESGANCAWVPSPTAATLHAMHYHQVDVAERQRALVKRARANLDHILTPPMLADRALSDDEIEAEIANNVQGILGYVVRWINQGVGCSKVPDISNVGLMEDRATLRISSQHLANWLRHGVCSEAQVESALSRMAKVVDRQNAHDPSYRAMHADLKNSIAFRAARALIFEGTEQPNGYTEPLLHALRRAAKRNN